MDDTIESLRLAHDNGIKDTTRGAGASDTIHQGKSRGSWSGPNDTALDR